jgi:uncharacterized membrane protein
LIQIKKQNQNKMSFENSDEHQHNINNESDSAEAAAAAAATSSSDDNGFIVVTDHPEATVAESLADIGSSIDTALMNSKNLSDKVLAEADSSSSVGQDNHHHHQNEGQEGDEKDLIPEVPREQSEPKKQQQQDAEDVTPPKAASSSSECSLCPYYALGCNYLSQVQVPPKVRDLLLWSCPKLSGAVFGSTLVLLLSLSCFSLLTVVSSVLLLGLLGIGAYRFYLAIMFRIKGNEDKTFENLSQYKVSLPKDKIQELAKLLDSDLSRVLNQLKSIFLWDSLTTSGLAFVGLYFIYWIGSIFNTLTLMIIVLVDLFTLPKVYQVYKVQIDQGMEKATAVVHGVVQQLMKKLPFLSKKKTQ